MTFASRSHPDEVHIQLWISVGFPDAGFPGSSALLCSLVFISSMKSSSKFNLDIQIREKAKLPYSQLIKILTKCCVAIYLLRGRPFIMWEGHGVDFCERIFFPGYILFVLFFWTSSVPFFFTSIVQFSFGHTLFIIIFFQHASERFFFHLHHGPPDD